MTGEYLADYEGKIETELREYKEENVKSETGFVNHSEKINISLWCIRVIRYAL